MLAPIDAKVTLEIGGEPITLALNFRAAALAEAAGVDPFNPMQMTTLDTARLVRALATEAHPDITDEQAFALVFKGGESIGKALVDLYSKAAGVGEAGNGTKAGK